MNLRRFAALSVLGALLLGSAAACAEQAPPDQVGLYYAKGSLDGNHFDHCLVPGSADDALWNNEVHYLPTSVRTWNISPTSQDSQTPITVNSKPEEGQPSGVQIDLWPQITLTLDTSCGDSNNDKNAPIVQFWERLGRRYNADQTDGWKNMLQNTVVTAFETSSRSVVRGYTANDLVSGVVREQVQQEISTLFQQEIQRIAGGRFFCSPYYDPRSPDPAKHECGEVEVTLKDVDYTNPAIQQARDEKQAAIEKASALVAEAQGKVDAAAKEGSLYGNSAWVQLQIVQAQKEMVQACAANPNCTIIIGGDGSINVTPSNNRS